MSIEISAITLCGRCGHEFQRHVLKPYAGRTFLSCTECECVGFQVDASPPDDWHLIVEAPEQRLVVTKVEKDGVNLGEHLMIMLHGQWFMLDNQRHIYNTPTHWREYKG